MRFFLGTNGPNGFFSYFDQMIEYGKARHVQYIKGGPGCGKSTYMKTIATHFSHLPQECILCSSDPASFDALVLPEQGIAFVDATAPHALEPRMPGIVDNYVNLGLYTKDLSEKRDELERLLVKNKQCYRDATHLISAANTLESNAFDKVVTSLLIEKISSRGKALALREIPKTMRAAVTQTPRFLSSITPEGWVCHFDTVTDNFERVIAIDDNFGLATFLLTPIVQYAVQNGYKTFACYSPLQPETQLEHVLIPELNLAFVTNSRMLPYPTEATRHVRMDAIIAPETIRKYRSTIRFLQKSMQVCIQEAVALLQEAKQIHDEIEALYADSVDFETIDAMAQAKIAEITEMLQHS